MAHCWRGCDGSYPIFQTSYLSHDFNATAVTLVPNIANPTNLSDFIKKSCCTTLYKCISKLLARRLKPILPFCDSQSAFIEGRHGVGDNVLLAQKLLRNYHRKTISPRCAIKVDLRKAYEGGNFCLIPYLL